MQKKKYYANYIKRPLDILFSFTALVMLSPVLLVVGFLVKYKLGSPIIFKQDRPGKNEKQFSMYKFRTMTSECGENGVLLPDELRLTKFGRLLRSTSLDELPELWNIFIGDMSIVGPRPLLTRYLPYYSEVEKKRHSVRPGLTGLSQINGRNLLGWDTRLELDVQYVKQISFVNDVKIVILTIKKVITRQNIVVGDEQLLKDLDLERKK